MIVERIIQKRNGARLMHDVSFESLSRKPSKPSLKKSRQKRRNASLILPKIDTPV